MHFIVLLVLFVCPPLTNCLLIFTWTTLGNDWARSWNCCFDFIAGEWEIGDGKGDGYEVHIGTFPDKEACYLYCKYQMSADGATVDAPTEKKCYCEYGMKQRNSNTDWKSSFIKRY